jgi:hypothetical protein
MEAFFVASPILCSRTKSQQDKIPGQLMYGHRTQYFISAGKIMSS